MLLKFGARNFFCFKEGVELSFELPANCPKTISKGKTVANLICVKGANASGKTNALKIISFLQYFCKDSFANKPESKINVDSYFLNEQPIDIFCDMEIKGIIYHYEVSLTDTEIISETLFRNKKRNTEVFKRERNKPIKCIEEFNDLKRIKLRPNASIISTAHQYDSKCISPVYNFFDSMLSNVRLFGRYDIARNYESISKLYQENQECFDFAKAMIKKCDLGIKDIEIHSRQDEEGKDKFFPLFEHEATVKNNKLSYMSQSSGTRALYRILPFYMSVLETGGVLVLDEFDINFHPDILPLLVGIFDDEQLNKKNAQMIFTTHNTEIMNTMGKYRTILVNQEESESYGYRLDEIPGDIIRNDRPLAPLYKTGKIGGVPRI